MLPEAGVALVWGCTTEAAAPFDHEGTKCIGIYFSKIKTLTGDIPSVSLEDPSPGKRN